MGTRQRRSDRRAAAVRRAGRAIALTAAGVLAASQVSPAAAARSAYDGAEEHYAGSQIARHEGGGSATPRNDQPLGNDVSRWQGDVDWDDVRRKGAKFSYVKATEGTGYTSPKFTQQYNGAYRVGLVRGAYHFARPDLSGGAAQADYFVDHGGRWSSDGRTLPGALDVEYNPYGDDPCYGKSAKQMTGWVRSFVDRYEDRTGRAPAIYTSTSWWRLCTGDATEFGDRSPLWIARYRDSIGELPSGWPTHTIWQFADSGKLPGDQNYFNGSERQLRRLAAS